MGFNSKVDVAVGRHFAGWLRVSACTALTGSVTWKLGSHLRFRIQDSFLVRLSGPIGSISFPKILGKFWLGKKAENMGNRGTRKSNGRGGGGILPAARRRH